MKHVAIIIPALNEGGNIRRLIAEIPDLSEVAASWSVIVVNNGSTDNTAQEAEASGAIVVHEARRGYGYACRAGVAAATHADVLAFMDGDGSFDPKELLPMLRLLDNDEADLVLGSRAANIEVGAMPPHQRYGNRLVARLMDWLYGLTLTDLGPFRVIRRDLVMVLDMCEMTFGWPTEMLVKAVRCGARVCEVPVHYRKRWSGKSKVSGTVRGTLLATYYILGITLRYAFVPMRSSVRIPKR
jgi:glycosyltransferase involved in cell wall biosynthesis